MIGCALVTDERERDVHHKKAIAEAWYKLYSLGKNQMRKDPEILSSLSKIMTNSNISSNQLDKIIVSMAEGSFRCRTCANSGNSQLRYVYQSLDDLDEFANEFYGVSGYGNFLKEFGEQGNKAIGGDWTLEAIMHHRNKYFGTSQITGFEISHVPNRDFAADVVTDVGGVNHFTEFKSWSNNLMGKSNMIDQITGTITVINNLDEMKFIFNPSRWKPTTSEFKTALQSKKSLIEAIPNTKRTQLFGTTNTDEIIDILSSDEVFEMIIKVQ